MLRSIRPIKERFEEKYIPVTETGCWLWTAAVSEDGYGRIENGRRGEGCSSAHRVAFELYRGKIPDNKQIDHLCRVRCCVNPWHLEVVSSKENILRSNGLAAINAKKQTCIYGHDPNINRFIDKQGKRQCRECARIRARNYRSRQKYE